MCNEPKLIKPETTEAATSMSVCECYGYGTALKPVPVIKTVRGEKRCERRLITALTPITNAGCVFSPRVKHGTNNHEARRDGTFTYSEDKTNGEKTGKVLASRMAA